MSECAACRAPILAPSIFIDSLDRSVCETCFFGDHPKAVKVGPMKRLNNLPTIDPEAHTEDPILTLRDVAWPANAGIMPNAPRTSEPPNRPSMAEENAEMLDILRSVLASDGLTIRTRKRINAVLERHRGTRGC